MSSPAENDFGILAYGRCICFDLKFVKRSWTISATDRYKTLVLIGKVA